MNSGKTRAARDFFAQKLACFTGPVELDGMIRRLEAITVVDVRLPQDFREGHVPGAINLPQGRWHTLDGLSKERTAVLYGYTPTCQLATAAAVELASHGIPVKEMQGGFETWNAYGLEVQSGTTV